METARESELQGRQHAWWWPLDTMACSSGSSDMSNSDSCFLQLQWDPLLRYCFFGLGVVGVPAAAGDDHRTFQHELELFFPKCMELPGSSEAPEKDDTTAMPEDQLDELLRNFWDAEEEEEEQLAGLNSSCILEEKSADAAAASPFLDDDDLLALCSALPVGPTSRDEPVAGPQPAPSSSSSHCTVAPQAGDDGGARRQTNCSSKRSETQEDEWSCKRSRTDASSGAGPSVVRPFTVVKPGGDGVDGEATLADINERILSRPTRPVRHPVGKFACAPRALAGGDNRPAPSGKAVAGFTRLHTAGKGTITIIRTSG